VEASTLLLLSFVFGDLYSLPLLLEGVEVDVAERVRFFIDEDALLL
jgi:hypothetical protein